MNMDYGVMDVVGNIGVLMLMFTYLALQLDKIKGRDLSYSVLNAVGASLIVASLIVNFNLSAMLMEVFWVLISFVGIGRHLRLKTARS
jgi:multidrug transporter EmrE-like cation transporter